MLLCKFSKSQTKLSKILFRESLYTFFYESYNFTYVDYILCQFLNGKKNHFAKFDYAKNYQPCFRRVPLDLVYDNERQLQSVK